MDICQRKLAVVGKYSCDVCGKKMKSHKSEMYGRALLKLVLLYKGSYNTFYDIHLLL